MAGHDLPLAVAGFVEKVTTQEGFVEVKFFVSNDAGAATNSGAAGWKPWHESLRQRERAILEAFEGVRRPVTDHTGGGVYHVTHTTLCKSRPDSSISAAVVLSDCSPPAVIKIKHVRTKISRFLFFFTSATAHAERTRPRPRVYVGNVHGPVRWSPRGVG